jgi:5-methylcytosine-specific restriction endonuclease McrA
MTQMAEDRAPPPRGTREWYLYKRRQRLRGRVGGRLARFREIAKRKGLTVEDTISGVLEPVFVSEFRYYVWNVEPVLCAYCNTRLTKQTRTRDHVIPRSRGGGNEDNLVPSCAPCNRAKADDALLIYMLRRDATQ